MVVDPRFEVISAIPTAFNMDGSFSPSRMTSLFSYLNKFDLDGYFVGGTAGEFLSLNRTERRDLATVAKAEVNTNKRLIMHVGSPSLRETTNLIADVRKVGIRDVAVITPLLLPTSFEAMYGYYREISDVADKLNVYIYIYPQISGNTLSPSETAELMKLPNIVGAKISGVNAQAISRYYDAVPNNKLIYAGVDSAAIPMVNHGARGIVSAVSAAFPNAFTGLARAKNDAKLLDLQHSVNDICQTLEGSIPRIRYALKLQGVLSGIPRFPLPEITTEDAKHIRRLVDLYAN